VDGFVLDVSRTGARVVLFATGSLAGGTVVMSIDGDRGTRLAVVQWARKLPDGSIVGVEFLEELDATATVAAEANGLALPPELEDDTAPLDEEITEIRAVPVWAIQDVPGAPRTLEEGSVVVMTCVQLVA